MAKVFSVSMNKGGVGKTSLVTNLGAALSSRKNKVLIIDTDGQGNASMAFSKKPREFERTIYDVLLNKTSFHDVNISINKHLDLVPANDEMNYLEFDVLGNFETYKKPFSLLEGPLQEVKNEYDYIIIDTPPSMGLVAGNVLASVDRVFIPFVPESFAVQGLIRLIEAVRDFSEKRNPSLKIEGVVATMIDMRTTLHSELLQKARQYCLNNSIQMFETVVPKSIRFANATAYAGKPAVWSDKKNHIVSAYFELIEEVLEHEQEKA